MLTMPEPALTSASLKGKGPLVDRRSSTHSISKQLPPTPVKGLPEIPSDDDHQIATSDNNNHASLSSTENDKPAPISKEKKKRSTLFFDKKSKDKTKDKDKNKKSCMIQ